MELELKGNETLVALKPDGNGIEDEFLRRIGEKGLRVIARKKIENPDENIIIAHYNKDLAWLEKVGTRIIAERKSKNIIIEKCAEEYGRDVLKSLVEYMTSGPIVAMIVQGNNAVQTVRDIVGSTEPLTSPPGTIRGDFSRDSYELANLESRSLRNLIHCSDSVEEAMREILLWFSNMFEKK